MIEQREACKVLIKHFKGKSVVGAEIGVCRGNHAMSLLQNIPNLHLHLVDNGVEMFHIDTDNSVKFLWELGCELKPVLGTTVKWHIKNSVEASTEFEDTSLDFVYIDAGHDFLDVRRDCEVWYPKVKVGGVICGHDYMPSIGDDVRRAVDGFFIKEQKQVFSARNEEDGNDKFRHIFDWVVLK